MKNIHKKIYTYTVIAFLFTTPLLAETQFYEAKRTVGETVADLINQLGNAKIQYSVKKIYNPSVDGSEGMLVQFRSSGAMCEIRFYQDAKIKKRAVIRVFAQDRRDAQKLHIILVDVMKMKLSHVSDVKRASHKINNWPARVPSR